MQDAQNTRGNRLSSEDTYARLTCCPNGLHYIWGDRASALSWPILRFGSGASCWRLVDSLMSVALRLQWCISQKPVNWPAMSSCQDIAAAHSLFAMWRLVGRLLLSNTALQLTTLHSWSPSACRYLIDVEAFTSVERGVSQLRLPQIGT